MSKNQLYCVIFSAMLVVGFSLMLYPSISNYWNSFHSSKAISNYSQVVSEMDEAEYQMMFQKAQQFNQYLLERKNPYILTDGMQKMYESILNPDGTGLIGHVEIPSINCSAALYHTAEERVLQKGIGHLSWTSLPIGGESTHAVLSGHRGLPTAKLFSDMDKVVEGDYFYIYVLDEVFKYKVDRILIVEPKETEELLIVPEKDYCTLVTCTPYGINTHRMLVRGERVEVEEKSKLNIVSEVIQIDPLIVASIIAIPMLLLLFIWLHIPKANRRGGRYDTKK